MLKKIFSGISFKLIVVWLLLIITLDLTCGYFGVPKKIKEGVKLHNLSTYYNHGFNKNATGEESFGSFKYTLFTNSMGMVDERIREVKKEDKSKRRILFIGDSFTEGKGNPYKQTFCGFLNYNLDTNKIEILNAGVGSYSPKLYYLRTKNLVEEEKLQVDELFCFIDYTDVGDELVYEDFVSKRGEPWYYPIYRLYRKNSLLFFIYITVNQRMWLHKTGIPQGAGEESFYWTKTNDNFTKKYPDFFKVRRQWIYLDNKTTPTLHNALKLAFNNMINLSKLCQQHKIKLTIVVYPPDWLLNEPKAHKASFVWQQFCQNNQINFISLFPLFITDNLVKNNSNQKKYYIPGDSHWNAEGHKLVADSIYKYLCN
jgi:lysophospholipase L1-like esterase